MLSFNGIAQNDTIIPNLYGQYCVQTITQFDQQFVYNYEEFEFVNDYPDHDTLSVVYNGDTIAILAVVGDQVYIKKTGVPFFPVYAGWNQQFELSAGFELLYDFGLNVGDTAYHSYTEVVVDSIDYINVQGEFRKRLLLENGEQWIAGLGSTHHPLTAVMYYFEVGYTLCSAELEYFGGSTVDFDTYNGSCSCNIGLNELEQKPRKLLLITDLMGREVRDTPNTPLIYIYSDGTKEKVFRIE